MTNKIGRYTKAAASLYPQLVPNSTPVRPALDGGDVAVERPQQSLLKKIRRDRGLTLEVLSQLTDVSPSYLSRLENGNRRLNTDLLERLSSALRCEPSELLSICGGSRGQESSWTSRGGRSFSHEPLAGPGSFQGVHQGTEKDLPVFTISTDLGAFPDAETSPSAVDFSKPADWVFRTHHLMGVKKAFGLYVVDEGFAPRYMPGDVLYVHPTKALLHRCSVFVLFKTGRILIRQFHGWSEDSVRLSTFKTYGQEADISLVTKEELKAVHKIIGAFEC